MCVSLSLCGQAFSKVVSSSRSSLTSSLILSGGNKTVHSVVVLNNSVTVTVTEAKVFVLSRVGYVQPSLTRFFESERQI